VLVNLKKFYEENPATEFVNKRGETHQISGKRYSADSDDKLNSLQIKHRKGELNLYAPVETYSEKFTHNVNKRGEFISATPIAGTRVKDNLPPIAEQWKREFSQLLKKEKRRVKDG
tara:strand:- start:83 stop:430 length:348 start_codon:yes stop_codon:yes gene_type:complete